MALSDYPKELTSGRESTEASFVFCLWKQPDLYDDYIKINDNGDQTLKTPDGIFYFSLGRQLYQHGYKLFDSVTLHTYLADKPALQKEFDKRGGFSEAAELMELVAVENIGATFDQLAKSNTLLMLYDKGFNVQKNMNLFAQMSNQDVYDYFEYQLNSISIHTGHEAMYENLLIDEAFIEECDSGMAKGVSYSENCKLLNYLTLGLPLGELFMLAGHSGVGKTSFVFENMILPITHDNIMCAVISNEQRAKDFKLLLLVHVLTHELNYWGLTRKKLKMGGFTPEQKEMVRQAQRIIEEKYASLLFVKHYDSDANKVKKMVRKLSKLGYQVILYDTMKSDDAVSDSMWQELLISSRLYFQLASKENIALIMTYQLALHTLNKRYLDASCLSNAKQIKEVFSEMVYLRPLWNDEYSGERFDVKPYKFDKSPNGEAKIRKCITLDPNKKYIVAFLDKTRNDEDKQQVLYEFNGRFNVWRELGYCSVVNLHN